MLKTQLKIGSFSFGREAINIFLNFHGRKTFDRMRFIKLLNTYYGTALLLILSTM